MSATASSAARRASARRLGVRPATNGASWAMPQSPADDLRRCAQAGVDRQLADRDVPDNRPTRARASSSSRCPRPAGSSSFLSCSYQGGEHEAEPPPSPRRRRPWRGADGPGANAVASVADPTRRHSARAAPGSGRCPRQNPAMTRSKRSSPNGSRAASATTAWVGGLRRRSICSAMSVATARRAPAARAASQATAVPAPTSSTVAPDNGNRGLLDHGGGEARVDGRRAVGPGVGRRVVGAHPGSPRKCDRRRLKPARTPRLREQFRGVVTAGPPPRPRVAPTRRARRRSRRRPSPTRTGRAPRAG